MVAMQQSVCWLTSHTCLWGIRVQLEGLVSTSILLPCAPAICLIEPCGIKQGGPYSEPSGIFFISWPCKDLCWDRGAFWAVSSHSEEVSVKKQGREYMHTAAVCPAGSMTGCAALEQREGGQPVATAPAGPPREQLRTQHWGGDWWGQTEAGGVMGLCFWSCSMTVRERNVLSEMEWIVMKRRLSASCSNGSFCWRGVCGVGAVGLWSLQNSCAFIYFVTSDLACIHLDVCKMWVFALKEA